MALPPNIKLTDYIPDWDEIDRDTLLDARDRIVTYLQSGIADLDTSPGSVFGDLHINPLSHLVAAFEIAANRMFSDLDLANIASGYIHNCDFVKRYLDNFGQKERPMVGSYGVVQLVFSSYKSFVIPSDTKFLFGDNLIFQLQDRNTPIIISKTAPVSTTGLRALKQVFEDYYTLELPVVGPAGAIIKAGDQASTDLTIFDLTEVTAISDFDSGLLPLSVSELASNVSNTFYASSLNNRSGAITYILNNFPEIIGVSPVMTGDAEMLRGKQNILGITEGKADLYVKYRKTYLPRADQVELIYDAEEDKYVGLLNTEKSVPVYLDKITYQDETPILETAVFGTSVDQIRFPNVSAAFSTYENLGLKLTAPDAIQYQEAGFSNILSSDDSIVIQVSGQYNGSVFTKSSLRNIKIQIIENGVFTVEGNTITAVRARATDTITGESVIIYFVQNGAIYGTVVNTAVYENFLNGVVIDIKTVSGDPLEDDAFDVTNFTDGAILEFSAKAQSSLFNIHYRYDPNLLSVQEFVDLDHARAVNVDLVVKSFHTCYVKNITINYRVRAGQSLDVDSATSEIATYINSITYPNVYESSQIMEIVLYYGAEGVSSVTQTGIFYQTLAQTYIENDTEIPVKSYVTNTLHPDDGIVGIGYRNINYILDLENIKFNVKTV